MSDNVYLGKMGITASISYWNCFDIYKIGFSFGGEYTILDKDFKTKDDAHKYLFDKFYGNG